MHYVVGFQFNNAGDRVALIKKGRPEWQAGLWNGIGGGVERGESAEQAMEREFQEETELSQRTVI
jgi:8-oxo-dGTP diphosphatase